MVLAVARNRDVMVCRFQTMGGEGKEGRRGEAGRRGGGGKSRGEQGPGGGIQEHGHLRLAA